MAPDPRPEPAIEGRGLPGPMTAARPLGVALVAVAAAAACRLALEQLVPGLVPFLFTFPAVIGATLLAGAPAGTVALAGCQLLTLAFVLPHWLRDSGDRPQEAVNLALATLSLAATVWAAAAFRRLQLDHRRRCEREVETLSLLVREIDHRTKNNFQIAAAVLHAQGAGADPEVRAELDEAAGRLVSIAAIYGNLSHRAPEGGTVALRDHLEEICAGLRAGLLPPGVQLIVAGAAPPVPASTALTTGLVVNEWVTNAVKHAFAGAVGTIRVELAERAGELRVEVRDDGGGFPANRVGGTGSRLLASFVDALGGRMERRNDGGAVCLLILPLGRSRP